MNENTVANTGKGWKVEVPKANVLSIQNRANNDGEIDAANYLRSMKKLQSTSSGLYLKGAEIGDAPLECNEFSKKFQSLIAIADNIVLPFSERGLETWAEKNRNFLVKDAISNYLEAIGEMQYEYKKLH